MSTPLMPMHSERQRNGIVQGVCVAGLLMVLGYLWASNYVVSPQVHLSSATDPAHAFLTCTLREYVPSDWEQKWVAQVHATYSSNTICALMKEISDLSKDWLEGVTACKQDSGTLCAKSQRSRGLILADLTRLFARPPPPPSPPPLLVRTRQPGRLPSSSNLFPTTVP